MKKWIILKSFSDLTLDVALASGAPAVETPRPPVENTQRSAVPLGKRTENFLENLRRRATAPFRDAVPYRYWGLNE